MSRRGFTLVELVAGLAIAGLLLVLAGRLFADIGSRARQLERHWSDAGSRGRATAWLTEAFGSLQVGLGDDDGFSGEAQAVALTARLGNVHGWAEPHRIRLSLSSDTLLAVIGAVDSVRLLTGVRAVELQYLAAYGEQSEWLSGWHSPATAPLAVRLVLWGAGAGASRSDTLLFLIGPRG